jgi:hypothetical protein
MNAFMNNGTRMAKYDGITSHPLFIGGINGARAAVEYYNPLYSNFHRIVWTRAPKFVEQLFAVDGNKYSNKSLWIQFKHVMEYMCAGFSGLPQFSVDVDPMTGGHAGNVLNFPTKANWAPATLTVTLYELAGGLVDKVIEKCWMRQLMDPQSGYMSLGGLAAVDGNRNPVLLEEGAEVGTNNDGVGLDVNPASWSGEFIYIQTDPTGLQVEQAYYFSNVIPTTTGIDRNYTGADHNLTQAQITFNAYCTQSTIVNAIADKYLKKYYVASNSANWNPELGDVLNTDGTLDANVFGQVPQENSFGTNLGNRAAFTYVPQSTAAPFKQYDLNTSINSKNEEGVKQNPIFANPETRASAETE